MGKQSRRKKEAAAAAVPARAPAPPSPAWAALEQWALPAAAGAVLLCAFLLAAFPTRSDDLFMHLAVGRRFFQTGHFPDPDPWLFSLRDYHRSWIDVAYWGMHLGATKLVDLGGFTLLSLVKTLLVVAGAAAPLWLARRLGLRSFAAPAVLLLALWAACDRFIERGSLVSDCLGPWVLALTAAEMARPSRLRWLLPPLVLVWTNLHPGVATGLVFVLCGAALQWREWRRWLPVVVACLVASVVHPDGPRHLMWALQSVPGGGLAAFRKHNFEQMPTLSPEYAGSLQVWLFIGLAALSALAVGWGFVRRSRPWFGLVLVTALTYMGLSTIRFVTTAAMALPVVVVAVLAAARRSPATAPAAPAPRGRAWQAGVAALAVTAALAVGLDAKLAVAGYSTMSGPRRGGFGLQRSAYPFGAADFLKSLPLKGGIFNEHSFGAFLAWYWDGQPQIYFHGYLLDERFYDQDYLGANKSPEEFDRIVKEHDIGAFFMARLPVTPTHGPLLHRLLLTKPEWHLLYWDDRAIVFLRDRPEHQAIIAANEYRYFDPFRQERLEVGLRENPNQVLEEAVRVLHHAPDTAPARRLIEQIFKQSPDALLKQRYGR
ncbi:MAG TPA: hypothetical protein VGQ83_13755 [Polyangia bacterium]|jgi:hypothetical protein